MSHETCSCRWLWPWVGHTINSLARPAHQSSWFTSFSGRCVGNSIECGLRAAPCRAAPRWPTSAAKDLVLFMFYFLYSYVYLIFAHIGLIKWGQCTMHTSPQRIRLAAVGAAVHVCFSCCQTCRPRPCHAYDWARHPRHPSCAKLWSIVYTNTYIYIEEM